MTGAIVLGLILLTGGALLDRMPFAAADPRDEERSGTLSFYRAFVARRRVTRTGGLLQALGTVLVIIGGLALLL